MKAGAIAKFTNRLSNLLIILLLLFFSASAKKMKVSLFSEMESDIYPLFVVLKAGL